MKRGNMLPHKLVLDDVVDQPFKLIAIHSSIEDFRLAFLLNKFLNTKLARTREDVEFFIKTVRVLFALYEYIDKQNYCRYYLTSNKPQGKIKTIAGSGSLFENEELDSKATHLLPKFEKVDFFLKIEGEKDSVSEKILLERIKEIPQIATAYLINNKQLKTKENLIFD